MFGHLLVEQAQGVGQLLDGEHPEPAVHGLHSTIGLIGSIIVAFIGAVILVAILRTVSGSRSPV